MEQNGAKCLIFISGEIKLNVIENSLVFTFLLFFSFVVGVIEVRALNLSRDAIAGSSQDGLLEEKIAIIEDQEMELADLKRKIAERDVQLANKDVHLANRDKPLASRDKKLEEDLMNMKTNLITIVEMDRRKVSFI